MATARAVRAYQATRPGTTQSVPDNVAGLLRQLGGIPARRVLLEPPPGQATEKDVVRSLADNDRPICELVDSTLVAKAMGFTEAEIAGLILTFLNNFVRPRKLGVVAGADGPVRLFGGLVRIPDVSFVSWDRLPGRKRPTQAIPRLAPDLAVEVLSKGNTKAEMKRKVSEYFQAGTRLVWIVDIKKRTVQVFTAPGESVTLTKKQALDGGDVLPGFQLPLKELFAPLES